MSFYEITIPIPLFPTVYALAGLGVLVLIASWLVNNWPYKKQIEQFPKLHDRFGANVIAYLAVLFIPIWITLVVFTLDGIFELWQSPALTGDGDEMANRVHYLALVGLMGALAALLGTPLGLYRIFTTERQTKATEEGLITDRINKAVQGLGAEKTVERFGRPVTILFGEPTVMNYWVDSGSEFKLPDRSQIIGAQKREPEYIEEKDHVEIVDKYEVKTWPSKRTEIEWRDEPLAISPTDRVDSEGEWQVFKQTVPNLEVRIGAIYALERIAQDSLRDHIQIMEILCAYIRENSKADNLEPTQDLTARPVPREDIQTGISVLGRRTLEQRKIEVGRRYRLDLRKTNLSGVNFSKGYFGAAMFHDCRLEDSIFQNTNLEGTQFFRALLNFSVFWRAYLKGTRFDRAVYNRGSVVISPVPRNADDAIFVNGADFSSVSLSPYFMKTFGTKDTRFNGSNIDFEKLERFKLDITVGEPDVSKEELEEARRWLDSVTYRFWSPYTVDDGATYGMEREFREYHLLNDWPHTEE